MRFATNLLKANDVWLGPLALTAAGLLRRVPAAGGRSERPLIVRPGGMGDLICLCMALEALGVEFGSCRFVIEERSRPWAEHLGLEYVCYDRGLARLLWSERGRHLCVIDTEQFFGLAQGLSLVLTARAGKLTGFATNRCDRAADARVDYDWDRGHERDEFARLLARALQRTREAPSGPRARRLPVSGPPVVAIAGLQSLTRRLGLERWSALVEDWLRAHRFERFWIAAAPSDREFARALQRQFLEHAELIGGDFDATCAAIAGAERVFTVDGGSLHISSYYGVPATAVFTSGREQKWAPLGEGSELLRRDGLACQPCTRFGQTPACPHGLACGELDFARHRSAL